MTKFKTKDVLLKNKPGRIPRDQWTGLVSSWVSEKDKRRSQTNRNNRAKQKMPHTGGLKSIATLMDEKAKKGIEPTRAQVFILTHKPRKDGRPLDEEPAKTIVPNANSGHERVQQSPQMLFRGHNVAKKIPSSHGHIV
ncbi:uncharacterized protein LOC132606105 [Lycium barbarum]|uniref:uncharacterized protein LOC132606105 n=1 Tax=Lycium barbarum TaxID=112863 RepID=UPI00293E1252|nr:uncharacterized protein LOC132606105 [Lycium barbarum]